MPHLDEVLREVHPKMAEALKELRDRVNPDVSAIELRQEAQERRLESVSARLSSLEQKLRAIDAAIDSK